LKGLTYGKFSDNPLHDLSLYKEKNTVEDGTAK
jgi:hypothetical protein